MKVFLITFDILLDSDTFQNSLFITIKSIEEISDLDDFLHAKTAMKSANVNCKICTVIHNSLANIAFITIKIISNSSASWI